MKKAIKQSTLATILNGGSILLVIFGATFFIFLTQFNAQMAKASQDRYDLIINVNRFRNASAYLTNEVRAYAANGDTEHYDNYWNEVNSLKNRDIGVANMKSIGLTSEEERLISNMANISESLIPVEEQAMKLSEGGKFDDAINLVYGDDYDQQVVNMNQDMQSLISSIEQRTNDNVNAILKQVTTTETIVTCAISLIVLLQILSLLMIQRKIIRPIKLIRDEMLHFADGELHTEFSLTPDTSEIGQLVGAIHSSKTELAGYIDEIDIAMESMASGNFDIEPSKKFLGDFANIETSIRNFIQSMSSTLDQINQAAQQVAHGANQVSDSAQSLAQGATEQAGSIQELSSSLSEVSDQANLSTENSEKATQMSLGAATAVGSCNEQMENLMGAMQEIEDKSGRIHQIIKTIDDIAFQTNILALNAAVEAARAGEAGKGFAVVADEVRNLASKSAEAASNTADLIEQTVNAIDRGNELTQSAAAGLREIVTSAKETTELVSAVNNASRQQAEVIMQINAGIDQISQVITSNSATSEESAAASEELSGLASLMQDQVSRFKIKPTYPALPQ